MDDGSRVKVFAVVSRGGGGAGGLGWVGMGMGEGGTGFEAELVRFFLYILFGSR